eukprot:9531964-Heterocapsa_arctica.AAC.1
MEPTWALGRRLGPGPGAKLLAGRGFVAPIPRPERRKPTTRGAAGGQGGADARSGGKFSGGGPVRVPGARA